MIVRENVARQRYGLDTLIYDEEPSVRETTLNVLKNIKKIKN